MIRQTGLAQAIDIAGNRAKYDECAKKLLRQGNHSVDFKILYKRIFTIRSAVYL